MKSEKLYLEAMALSKDPDNDELVFETLNNYWWDIKKKCEKKGIILKEIFETGPIKKNVFGIRNRGFSINNKKFWGYKSMREASIAGIEKAKELYELTKKK